MSYTELIPGLPHEIAQECLVRVQHGSFPSACHVCRQWRHEFQSAPFHSVRKSNGVTVPLIITAQAVPSADVTTQPEPTDVKSYTASSAISYRLTVFHPVNGDWAPLPAVPGLPVGIPLFCQLAVVGRKLVVLGGWDPATWAACDWVLVFDFMTGFWRRGAPIPGAKRSFFACAASQDSVFIAGGHDSEKNALKSAFKYDVATDTWQPLPDMPVERDEPKGIFVQEKFWVLGGYITSEQGNFKRSAQSFDLASWQWGPVEEAWLDEDPKAPIVVKERLGLGFRVYGLRENGQVAVKGLGEGEEWRVVGEIPDDARMSARIADAGDRGIVVIGSGSCGGSCSGSSQVGYVGKEEEGKGVMRWQRWGVEREYWGHIQGICSMEI